ncbi:DUF1861 family protein [Paenibacillus rhizoplanae]
MKDIRLVALADGRIGVFSRPRGSEVKGQYGSESMIGFTVIDKLEDLTADVIENAPYLHGILGAGEWGGVNQAYLLDSGKIGIIGHICYQDKDVDGKLLKVYLNMAFIFDPITRESHDLHLIGSRSCYPPGARQVPIFDGLRLFFGDRDAGDGKADLYSGVGDCQAGRITIDYPFAPYGSIV